MALLGGEAVTFARLDQERKFCEQELALAARRCPPYLPGPAAASSWRPAMIRALAHGSIAATPANSQIRP